LQDGAICQVNARAFNTTARSLVALPGRLAHLAPGRARLALGCALGVVCLGLAGCGGGSQSVSSIVAQAFHPSQRINSGRLDLSLGLSATGVATLTAPAALRLQGPFQSTGPGRLPRFALGVDLDSSQSKLTLGATSTGRRLFIELQGISFQAPGSAFRQLEQGYAQSTAASPQGSGQSSFASLGIDPSAWIVHPQRGRDGSVGGVEAAHVTAGLDAARFLADLNHLAGLGGALGLGGASSVPGGLSGAEQAALARSVTSAHVDVYAGKGDHVLRELSVRAAVAAQPAASTALHGLRTGTLAFRLLFSDLNRAQTIVAPSNPQPLSKLSGLLGQP
jgi:hypothetical protein